MSDLKAPTYKYRSPVGRAFTIRHFIFSRSDIFMMRWRAEDVGPEGADLQKPNPRRSGLHGPTAFFSRSDIFIMRWHTEDDGPEGTDLQIPMPSRRGIQG